MPNKTQKNNQPVDEFISSLSDESRKSDCLMLVNIMKEITKDPPTMWGTSMIGYGTYQYKYASGREGSWFKFGFSPRKQNLTLYIMTGFDEYAAKSGYDPTPLLRQLGPHTTGKSCLYIKSLKDVNIPVLKELIKDSYYSL